MTYSELRDTYKYAFKTYYLYSINSEDFSPEMITTNYIKRGSRWIMTNTKTETVDYITYLNVIDATPFFKNLGGRERVLKTYTRHGYIPYEISSISPDKEKKTVRTFKFE